jgi:uncharacterized BrkB/YihY/UPF0761 family membrane protein
MPLSFFVQVISLPLTTSRLPVDELRAPTKFYERIETAVGAETAWLLADAVQSFAERPVTGTTVTSVIRFLVLLLAASQVFFRPQHALSSIWRPPPSQRGETRSCVLDRSADSSWSWV